MWDMKKFPLEEPIERGHIEGEVPPHNLGNELLTYYNMTGDRGVNNLAKIRKLSPLFQGVTKKHGRQTPL